MNTEIIPVAVYARASSVEQVASTRDQLNAMRKEAPGFRYRIVKEYVDEGKSGSREIAKRVAFHQMIADSAKREFTRIFVWDSSRFGRLDSQKAGEHKIRLRANGVHILHSLGEGVIDWGTQMGRLTDALMSEASHDYAIKIGVNSIRGRMAQLERKVLPHSRLCLGFDRVYHGDGQTVRITRNAKFRKPRTWTREIVINDEDAAIVRRIFDAFVNRGHSMGQVARQLRDDGIPFQFGKTWNQDGVKKVLTSRAYLGYGVISEDKRSGEAHHRMTPQEVPNCLPVILEGPEGEQLFQDAQRLLAKNVRSSFKSNNPHRALNGVLRCGVCGYILTSKQRQRGASYNGDTYYVCSAGQRGASTCPQWKIDERVVLPAIIKALVGMIDAEILAQQAPKTDETPDVSAAAVKQVVDLRESLKRATMRMATCDDEMLEHFAEVTKDLKAQLTQAEDRLKQVRHVEDAGGASLWAGWWSEVRPGLVLASGDPELKEELEEAIRRHPALASVTGEGGFAEFSAAARASLIRVAADGQSDPLLAILPELLEGESQGVLVDASTLRGTLRRLGCEAVVHWVRNPDWKRPTDPQWVPDRANLVVRWGVVADAHTAGTGSSSPLSRVNEPEPLSTVIRFR